jgi:hypothetical protein
MILIIKNVKRNKKTEDLVQSQKGAMEKFIIKEPHVSPPDNQEICSLHGNDETESENIFEQDPNNTKKLDGSPGANIDDASNASHVEDDSFQPDIFDPMY